MIERRDFCALCEKKNWRSWDEADSIATILEKTKPASSESAYELFKTSAIFDSTAAHQEWLGYNPQM